MDPTKEEYEIQYYGFSLKQLKTEHRLVIAKTIQNLTKILAESGIQELSQTNDSKSNEIREKVDKVSNKIFESFDNSLNEFDKLVDKYFTIPDNVLLEEDKIHSKNYTENDEEFYKEKIEMLKNSIMQNKYFLARLNSDIEKFEKLQELMIIENELADKVDKSLHSKFNLNETEYLLNEIEKKIHDEI